MTSDRVRHDLLLFSAALILTAWYCLFLLRPIDISVGDLGRHLKNGELLVSGWRSGAMVTPLLTSNFYSYTFPDFPFINHHWASGVFFYGLWSLGGITLLQWFFALVSLATLFLYMRIATERAPAWLVGTLAFFLVPLVAERRDIRPEMFTYLLAGLFLWILLKYRESLARRWPLVLLPLLMMLWVNLHIYFIFGIGLVGIFLLDALWRERGVGRQSKTLGLVLATCLLATLVNPSGYRGSLYPVSILHNFGLSVQEGLSVSQASKADFATDRRALYFGTLAIGIFLFAALAWRDRKRVSLPLLILFIVMSGVSWKMIRNVSFFGLMMIPILSLTAGDLLKTYEKNSAASGKQRQWKILLAVLLVLFTLTVTGRRLPEARRKWGIGILPEPIEASAFLKKMSPAGPLYNDFGSGGYVIFSLYPTLRPFVDNRPEAYPAAFLENEYTPARVDEGAWHALEAKYRFNVLLLHLTSSRASLPFAVRRLDDPLWSPIFVNNYHMIFLRRSPQNADIIQEHEIPRDRFHVGS